MVKTSIWLAATATAAGILAADAHAAQIILSVGDIVAYNNAVEFVQVPFNPYFLTKGLVYEFPVYFQLTDLLPGQSFGNLSFNVKSYPSWVPDTAGGPYSAATVSYTSGKTQVPYYSINGDQNNPTDLQGIVAAFPQGIASSPRAAAGVGSPFLLGYVYLDLPANAIYPGNIEFTPTQFSLNNNGTLVVDTGQMHGVILTWMPEPASASVLGVAGASTLARRRRKP